MRNEALLNRRYHDALATRLADPDARKTHIAVLQEFYRNSLAFVTQQGWEDPLSKPTPNVLLCGTGSAQTSSTFVNFVHDRNPSARIYILDLSPYPLRSSQHALSGRKNVIFVQEDATQMTFPANFFDWTETDAFLQFFPPEKRKKLFDQLKRVLKKGAVFTTREPVSVNDTEEIARQHREAQLSNYGVETFRTTIAEIESLSTERSFDMHIKPVLNPINPNMHSSYIVLRK